MHRRPATPYTVFGYEGKQVRDNIHSADLVDAFDAFHARAARRAPSTTSAAAAISNCSMLEAIDALRADRRPRAGLDARGRATAIGDHSWWISDLRPFRPTTRTGSSATTIEEILREIHDANTEEWRWRRLNFRGWDGT